MAKHSIPIIDADILAREVIEPGTSGFDVVVRHFGPDRVLRSDGTLDRAAIGDIVFHDHEQRKWLNSVVHPRVRRAIAKAVGLNWLKGQWAVVLDVPLLIEAGLHLWVGDVAVVYVYVSRTCEAQSGILTRSNERLQLSRLLSRPADPPLTQPQAEARIASQMPLSTKTHYASSVLDNSGTPADLSAQVDTLVKRWRKQQGGASGWWWRACWLLPPVGMVAGALCVLQNWLQLQRRSRRRSRGEVERRETRKRPEAERIEMRDMSMVGEARKRGSSGGSILD